MCFSPFSISTIMAMISCAAEDETQSELRSALGYPSVNPMVMDATPATSRIVRMVDIGGLFKLQWITLLNCYALSFVNVMLSRKDIEIKDEYKNNLANSFKAFILKVDFLKDGDNAVRRINQFVKGMTRNKIPNMLDKLDPSTVTLLMNAVYFKGNWSQKFDKASTSVQKFYNKGLEHNVKEVNMMHRKEKFPYVENESFQALQLPYSGGEVAMLVLLPRSKDGLDSVESSLAPSVVQDLKTSMQKQKVEVSLPRFRLEYSKSLVPYFQRLGIERAFKRGAQLGVACDTSNLFVSEIIHKAVLEVNEEGVEGNPEALVVTESLLSEDNPVFCADHPFAFIIYRTRSNLILFMGRVEEL